MMPLIGNSRTIGSVNNLITSGHLPHAIIISGEEGTGRHTLCNYIVSAAVCSGENKPCGSCRECNLVKNKNHPDITVIAPEDKKKSIRVETARELQHSCYIKPHMHGRKVYVFEKAENMSEVVQNTLLKIIEEPPQNILFIFICTGTDSLLDTVLSRCAALTLNPPTAAEAAEYLKAHTRQSDEKIADALKKSHNNIGKALKLLGKRSAGRDSVAEKFLDIYLSGGTLYELLSVLKPLDKERTATAAFISELKLLTVQELRQNPEPRLMQLYCAAEELEPSLITNINLSLFCTALVAKSADN